MKNKINEDLQKFLHIFELNEDSLLEELKSNGVEVTKEWIEDISHWSKHKFDYGFLILPNELGKVYFDLVFDEEYRVFDEYNIELNGGSF